MKVNEREKRLLLVLAGLGGLLLLRVLWSVSSPPDGPAVAPAATATAKPKGKDKVPDEVVALQLDRLDREPRDLAFGRDPFRYGPVPPPPPPPPPTKAELAALAAAREAARLRALEQAAIDAIPKPPPVTLKYLGSFGPEERRVAVFADEGGENLYNARAGDVLEGKFIVDRIGYESVDLKFVGFPDTPAKRLPIGG